MLYGSLADATARSPALAAALLADGLVEVLFADLAGEASEWEHRIPEPQVSWGSNIRWWHETGAVYLVRGQGAHAVGSLQQTR